MHGRNVDHIVSALAGDGDGRQVQGLSDDGTVDRMGKEFAELGKDDVGRGENRFLDVGVGAHIVVLHGENLGLCDGRYGQ